MRALYCNAYKSSMQIYAIDSLKQLIHVDRAVRGQTYTCPECQKSVRLRGGRFKQLHFFHFDSNPCRFNNKSQIHLHIQYRLQRLLAPHPVLIEHHFPQIKRIADVVWPLQKIVFEVQVSPITAQEVWERNVDYQKVGYRVVWILHHGHFNRNRVTQAEYALRASPHYFTNMNAHGLGFFYDQYAYIRFKRRWKRTPPLPIEMSQTYPIDGKRLPRHFPRERKNWTISFAGDLFHHPHLYKIPQKPPSFWFKTLLHPYRILLHYFLEKTSF
jgi:competence protein CoiA